MRKTYRFIDGELREVQKEQKSRLQIVPDIPDYVSPVTGKVVSGRVARREDLRRHGCIEIGPNDYKR